MGNAKKIILTRGIPASGKTTWAKDQVANGNGKIKRVNKDDLRAMYDAGKFSSNREKKIEGFRDYFIHCALADLAVTTVIVDDTNLSDRHLKHLTDLFGHEATIEVKDFSIALNVALQRDKDRPNSVGERVIRQMYGQLTQDRLHLPQPRPYNSDLPDLLICDIDGTVAHMVDRSPYEYDKVDTDRVDNRVADVLKRLQTSLGAGKPKTFFISGRDSECFNVTELWLSTKGFEFDALLMRPEGDSREDSIVKTEIYFDKIYGKFNVIAVLDDRDQVVDMWRDLGLLCLQVAPGNF